MLHGELNTWWHLHVCQWAGRFWAEHDPRWGWLVTWTFSVCDAIEGGRA